MMATKPQQLAQYFCTGAQLDPATWRHYALAVDMYTHFTSPIRRWGPGHVLGGWQGCAVVLVGAWIYLFAGTQVARGMAICVWWQMVGAWIYVFAGRCWWRGCVVLS